MAKFYLWFYTRDDGFASIIDGTIMIIGFTGSQILPTNQQRIISDRLDALVSDGMTHAITGACIGVDVFIAKYLKDNYPSIKQTIIIPSNTYKVGWDIINNLAANVINMPPGSSYRDRNERIVAESDYLEAFWTGKKIGSGTFMTINIAKKANKLRNVTMINGV